MTEPTLADNLRKKSIHDLRVMAQAFGIADVFSKDQIHLIQEIELKHKPMQPKAELPPLPVYDSRLMTKPPAKKSSVMELTELLTPYIERGLKIGFDENAEHWFMRLGQRTDEGTMRMPLRSVLNCARRMFDE